MISSYDLKYFIILAETKNLTFAAKKLNISQPALSHSLKRIEQEVGMSLFERSTRGIQLTHAGVRLFEKALNLEKELSSLTEYVKKNDLRFTGRFVIGCHASVGIYSLSPFILNLQNKYPDIELELDHGLSREILNRVNIGKVDLAIVVNPTPYANLVIRKLDDDEVTLWCLKSENYNKETLIYNPELNQTQEILKKLAKKNMFFKNKIESTNLELINELIHTGCGIGILPQKIIRTNKANSTRRYRADAPVYKDIICLVYRSGFQSTHTGKALIDCLKESFNINKQKK